MIKTLSKVLAGLLAAAYVFFALGYLGAAILAGGDFVEETRGHFLAALFAFASSIGFYYFTKFVERKGSAVDSLVSLERTLNKNFNILSDNIGDYRRSTEVLSKGMRYRFHLKQMLELTDAAKSLRNLDVLQTVVELDVEITRLNESAKLVPQFTDDLFLARYEQGMPDEAFRENLDNIVSQLEEGLKRHRQVRDEILEAQAVVKAALEKERTLFSEIVKQRFSEDDWKRVEEVKVTVRREIEESRANSRESMRKYGIAPEDDTEDPE